jgi:predicted MFS family arabinose efflux permease
MGAGSSGEVQICSFRSQTTDMCQLFTFLYYAALYFSAVKAHRPIRVGVDMFPTSFLTLPGTIVVAALISRTGRYRWAVWLGWAVSVVGCGLLCLLRVGTSTAVWATALAVFGVGQGMVLNPLSIAVQAVVDPEDAGFAATMNAFCRSLGICLGVAIGECRPNYLCRLAPRLVASIKGLP